MFNWFKKKKVTENPIEILISGINPLTDNEYLFFNFIEIENSNFIEKWFEDVKRLDIKLKPQYEKAIQQKILYNNFKNPHSFLAYFENKFDFIAIDFETANYNRISACAIGLIFVKDFNIVFSKKFYIKPPKGEKFSQLHSDIHNIYEEDVEQSFTFEILWVEEFSKYFNDNLIVFHNASMDLSVLKNLFEHFSITNFNIEYIDTMQLAEKSGNPKKIKELAEKFNIEIENHHDPISDAKTCALIYLKLIDLYPKHKDLIRILNKPNYGETIEKYYQKDTSDEFRNENLDIVNKYKITSNQLEDLEIENNNFVVTGKFVLGRENVEDFILNNGGNLKPGISNKVNFVIVGEDFGWSKIPKIHDLNTRKKTEIKILTEKELKFIFKKYNT